MVIDADALKCLAKMNEWWKLLSDDVVITPHPGEMSILTGIPIKEIQSDRMESAKKYAKEWKKIVVLKGAMTVIAGPDEKVCVTPDCHISTCACRDRRRICGNDHKLSWSGSTRLMRLRLRRAYLHAQAGQVLYRIVGSEDAVMAMDVIRGNWHGFIGNLREKK